MHIKTVKTHSWMNWQLSYEKLLGLIETGEPFRFMRWGDGEMRCVLRPEPHKSNCDGHPYYKSLSGQLQRVLVHQNRQQCDYHGIQRLGREKYPEFERTYPNISFCEADILHHASRDGQLGAMIDLLKLLPRSRKVVVVGPEHVCRFFSGLLVYSKLFCIQIPQHDCWRAYTSIWREMLNWGLANKFNHPVILYSASMVSEVLIDLCRYMCSEQAQHLDCGSVWDPYAGKISRSYHKKVETKQINL
jgi:hypothetical protein